MFDEGGFCGPSDPLTTKRHESTLHIRKRYVTPTGNLLDVFVEAGFEGGGSFADVDQLSEVVERVDSKDWWSYALS